MPPCAHFPHTINTASGAAGNSDLTIVNTLGKTAGISSTLTLNAVRNLAINAAICASGGPLPLIVNAGGAISANGGDINNHSFTILSGASITGSNNSRITFPKKLGSVKITYTATAAEGPEPVEWVTLSDWQPYIRELTWDPGTADAGTQVLTNTSTRAGRHYFHINTQATDIGAWKTRLTVATGEADLYLSQTAVPQTTSSIAANRKSERTGSDGLVLRSDEFAAPSTPLRAPAGVGPVSFGQCHRRRTMEHFHRTRLGACLRAALSGSLRRMFVRAGR